MTASWFGATYVNGTAGNLGAATDSPFHTGNLTIFTYTSGSPLVIFSGAQFKLYLSKDGFSQISTGDVQYAGPFLVSALALPLKGYSTANGTFYIGHSASASTACGSNCQFIEGPLPIQIAAGFSFIKIWDGSAVAALQFITISPGIRLSTNPSACDGTPMGPANRPVCVQGGGFVPNTLIDFNYSYSLATYGTPGLSAKSGQWQTGASTTSNGYFSYVYNMIDTKQSINTLFAFPWNDVVTISAVKHTYPHLLIANNPAIAIPATYTEMSRIFTQIVSFNQRGDLVVNDTAGSYYGNDSATGPVIPQPVPVYATGKLWIAGNFWTWGGSVTFWVSNGTSTGFNALVPASTTAGSSASAQGSFGVNVTMPTNIPIGLHTVKVASNGVYYTFEIYMNPTLVLNPHSGPASNPNTTVTVTVYGFPAGIPVLLYWNETGYNDGFEYNILNFSTLASGQINATSCSTVGCTFVVPETYGGDHNVTAWNANQPDFADITGQEAVVPNFGGLSTCFSVETVESFQEEMFCDDVFPIASALFTVTPSFVVIPGSFSSNYTAPVKAIGEGFIPGLYYSVDIDNQQADFSTTFIIMNTTQLVSGSGGGGGGGIIVTSCTRSTGRVCHLKDPVVNGFLTSYLHGLVTPNNFGQLNLTFIGLGFRPGVHVISLTAADENLSAGNYYPDAWAPFTVTTIGDPIAAMFAGITTQLNSISSQLTSMSGQLTAISGQISSAVTTLSGDISSSTSTITGAVSSATTTLSGDISSATTTITGAVSSATTTITGAISSATTTITTAITSATNTINTHTDGATSGLSGLGTQATNILNAVNTEQEYVLVVAVLAAITLVLVLAVLIRRLS